MKQTASQYCSHQSAEEAIFYSYKRHINGFAAVLDDKEASEIASKIIDPKIMDAFLSAFGFTYQKY